MKMLSTISKQTLIKPHLQTQIRTFARWTPYKPLPKPKHHQKLKTIKTLQTHLQNSYLISPFPCYGFSANQFKPLKNPISSDPSSSKIVLVKNSLVSKAFAGTQYHKLGPCLKGMNSLMFVKKEEAVGPSLGGVRAALKEGKMEFNDFTGAVVVGGGEDEGQLYGHLDLEVLESMPSRMEANGMLLGALFGPSSTFMALLEGLGGDDSEKNGGGGGGGESEVKDGGESPAP